MLTSVDRLKPRWDALMQACGVPVALGRAPFDELVAAYSEPHRAYHDLTHLEHMFGELDAVPLFDPAVEWATWYHDAVYEPTAGDNEERSAALADRTLVELGLEPLRAPVVQLIRATRAHHTDPDGPPGALEFLDADMSILGAEPSRYQRYARGVRHEYGHVPDPLYRAGRSRVLTEFLGRPAIFMTRHFRERYEARARENICDEIAALGAGSR